MGSDVTSSRAYDVLPGILIPWEWQGRTVTSTEVQHASPAPGPDTYAGTSRARLQLTGTPGYTDAAGDPQVPAAIDVVSVPGVAGRRLGWVWRRDGATPWFGQDEPTLVTAYNKIATVSSTIYSPSVIALQSGGLLAAWGWISGGVADVAVRYRAGHDWAAADADANLGTTMEAVPSAMPCALAQLADETVLLATLTSWTASSWGLAIWSSSDDGDTWEVQSYDAIRWSSNPPRVMRMAVMPDGRIILGCTENTGSSSQVRTLVSRDGGVTWEQIELAASGPLSGVCLWDLKIIRGGLVALVEYGGGAAGADSGVSRVDVEDPESAWVAAIATSGTEVYEQGSTEAFVGGGCIVDDPSTEDEYIVLAGADAYVIIADGNEYNQITGSAAQPSAVWWRGALESVHTVQSAGSLAGSAYATRIGGQSDVTFTRDYFSTSFDDDLSIQWIPLTSISTATVDSDSGGTPTRTNAAATGTRIQTDGATTAGQAFTTAADSMQVVQIARIRVASGTCRIALNASDGTDTCGMYVEITGTQIRAYDSAGAASSYTNHGATSSDYIDVMAVLEIRDGVAAGRAFWRADVLYPETCTGSISVSPTDSAGGTVGNVLRVLPSGDVYVLRASAASKTIRNRLAIPTAGTSAEGLLGVPLSHAEPRYLADGMSAQILSGVPRAEPDTVHRHTITGAAAYEHMWPEVVASPRWGWTAPSDVDMVIRLRPTESGTNGRQAPSEIFGLYLGGMVAIPGFTLTGFAYDASIDVDLRTPYRYTGNGYSVVGATSGGELAGQWVGQDELAGCYLECEDGLRLIVGNSPGSIRSGAAVAEVRAVLHLDGTPGADGLGYIWPRQAMVLVYDTGSRDWPGEVVITVDSAEAAPGTTRTIGTLAAGYVQPLGMQFDRTESHEHTIGDRIEVLADGTGIVSSQDPGRRRVEVSLVQHPHDVTEQWGTTSGDSSADYVGVPEPGTTLPGADADPIGALWSMLAARGRRPLVLVHMSRSDDAGQVVVQAPVPYRYGTLYGRTAGDPRWERISLQEETAVYGRMALIAIEEIT